MYRIRKRCDKGSSTVEAVLAVALLGAVLGPSLVLLSASTKAAKATHDRANAQAWLQTAADVLYATQHEDCGTVTSSREPAVRTAYTTAVRSTENPLEWEASHIRVVPPVLFWDGKTSFQATCYDDAGIINLQLITLEVTNQKGDVVESVQVVKG